MVRQKSNTSAELLTTRHNETITKILDFPLSINFKQLRRFTGLVSYFRDYTYGNQSEVLRPLLQLLEGMNNPTRELEWTDEASQVFSKIKDLISLQAQLFFANDDGLIYLLIDVSDDGIGGYLYQFSWLYHS